MLGAMNTAASPARGGGYQMLILNANAYVNGAFQPGTDVRIQDGLVTEVGRLLPRKGEETLHARNRYLLPGFVDVHIHAFRGRDTMEGEAAVRHMSRELHSIGVAAFLPTTMSASEEATREAICGIRAVMMKPEPQGSRVLGAHMEAPFLAEDKCGAQLKQFFLNPDMNAFLRMTSDHPEAVKLITMAPEKEGAEAFIRAARAMGVTVSIGHTCATCAQTHQAADWGATHVTHTFNAQPALHHREPGVVGAALTDDRLYAEMICDGIHLHPDIIRLIVRSKGEEKAVMVTDAMEAAGMPEGQYALGGQEVFVKQGAARLASGVLAGSILTMPVALHNMIHRFGIAPEQAVRMCTLTPAESIGEQRAGRILPGSPAPLTLWNEGWEMLHVLG